MTDEQIRAAAEEVCSYINEEAQYELRAPFTPDRVAAIISKHIHPAAVSEAIVAGRCKHGHWICGGRNAEAGIQLRANVLREAVERVKGLRERASKRQSFFDRGSINWKAMSLVLDEYNEIITALSALEAGVSEPCPDCAEYAKHAYGDATTPGFFPDKCDRHRAAATPSVPVVEPWKSAKRLLWHRLGALTNGNESWLTPARMQVIYDDVAEHFDIAAQPRGLELLNGKCSLDDYRAASLLATPLVTEEK